MSTRLSIFLCLAALAFTGGCISGGYQGFRPNATEEYDHLLEPLGGKANYWVRGRVQGDLDGDKRDEEVILATIHQGGAPAGEKPLDRLVLMICDRDEKGRLQLLLRRNIFAADKSLAAAQLPAEVHLPHPQDVMKHCTAKIVDVDGSGKGLLLISLWGNEKNGRVTAWHAAYRFAREKAPNLRRVFLSLAVQRGAAINTVDVDKDGQDELLLPQMVVTIPAAARQPGLDPPEWLSVFSRDADGHYRLNNAGSARAYGELLLPWYKCYVLALHSGAAAATLAPFEFYLGMIHKYRGEASIAAHFLKRARRNSQNKRLQNLAEGIPTRALSH